MTLLNIFDKIRARGVLILFFIPLQQLQFSGLDKNKVRPVFMSVLEPDIS